MFDGIIANMEANIKLSPIVTKLFLKEMKLYIFLAFIKQSYFQVPKTIRLNPKHYFMMKIPNKKELQ